MAVRTKSVAAVTIAISMLIVLALAALLLVTQLDKWTCAPPDGVWVEGPDHCMDLP